MSIFLNPKTFFSVQHRLTRKLTFFRRDLDHSNTQLWHSSGNRIWIYISYQKQSKHLDESSKQGFHVSSPTVGRQEVKVEECGSWGVIPDRHDLSRQIDACGHHAAAKAQRQSVVVVLDKRAKRAKNSCSTITKMRFVCVWQWYWPNAWNDFNVIFHPGSLANNLGQVR